MLLHDFCLTEVSEFSEKQISDSLCHLRFRWFLEMSSSVGRLCKIYKCLLNNCHILWNIWYCPSQIWGCRSSVLLKDLSCSVLWARFWASEQLWHLEPSCGRCTPDLVNQKAGRRPAVCFRKPPAGSDAHHTLRIAVLEEDMIGRV